MNTRSKTARTARSTCDQYKLALGGLELNHGILKSDYANLLKSYRELEDDYSEVNNENIDLRIELNECEDVFDDTITRYKWTIALISVITFIFGYVISGVILL